MNKKLRFIGIAAVCSVTVFVAPAQAHNAGCVPTGNGTWVSVGSGKVGPDVPEQNPHWHAPTSANDPDVGRLDLIEGSGDQYGARFAATRDGSAVVPPPPSPLTCESLAR